MRRSHIIAIGAFAIVVVIVAILQVIGNTVKQDAAQRNPLTKEDLDRLAEELAPPEASDAPQSASEPARTGSPSDPIVEALPRRLERAATAEERIKYFREKNALRSAAKLVCTNGAFVAACSLFGRDDLSAFFNGQAKILDGDWDGARSCFTILLEESNGDPAARHVACLFLAWLEDDPGLAAQYLEIACHDDASLQRGILLSASELAQATGSDALATHYRERYENFFSGSQSAP